MGLVNRGARVKIQGTDGTGGGEGNKEEGTKFKVVGRFSINLSCKRLQQTDLSSRKSKP